MDKKTPTHNIAIKRLNLGINLTRNLQKICRKELLKYSLKIMNSLGQMQEHPCSWIGCINLIKMPNFPTLIFKFNITSLKIPTKFFSGISQVDLKLH